MGFESIDQLSLAVPALEPAVETFERLGFRPVVVRSTESETSASATSFRLGVTELRIVELVGPLSPGLTSVTIRGRTPDHADKLDLQAGVPLVFRESASAAWSSSPQPFAVRRLDHLAAVATNLEKQTRYWVDVLGVPLFGEVVTPTMIIRQFQIGDAIIELLGPNSPDSPIHQRKPGLISMVSLEVPDLNAAVAQARAAGFTIPDPGKGVLPGTMTATIPAAEMSGLALQLLAYV